MKRHYLLLCLFLLLCLSVFGATPKAALASIINDSKSLILRSVEGTEKGECLPGSISMFEFAIAAAESVLNNDASTKAEFDAETKYLFTAYNRFLKQKHGITNPYYSDNYWSLSAIPGSWAHYNTHDPSIVYAEGYWYAFCTDAAWAYSSEGIPVKRSRDLVNWEARGWAFDGFPQEAKDWGNEIVSNSTMEGIWAPYIQKVGDEYRLFYCAIYDKLAAIILATSNSIEGPWQQKGVVLASKEGEKLYNAIDPTVMVDKEGRHWMIYGSWHWGIAYVELDSATGFTKDGTKDSSAAVRISRNRYPNSGWTNSTEGPEIVYNPVFDKYYLFLAQGNLGTVYHTRVARADHPTGPWYDYAGNNIDYSVHKDIYPLIEYPYKFNNHPGWVGIAHSAVFSDGEDFYISNQARPVPMSSMMVMHTRKLFWTEDGWPIASPQRYTNPGIMPEITEADIAGTWEVITLTEKMNGGVCLDVPAETVPFSDYLCTPTTLVFNSDGTIGASRRWRLSGDTIIVSTTSALLYKGLLHWELDWENQKPTLVYTALNSSGKGIWGKKVEVNTAQSENMILNGNFEEGIKHWIIESTSGSFTSDVVELSSGKAFHVTCSQKANNYWEQQIRWLFPAERCARYRISFKARANVSNVDLRMEIQDANTILPIIRTAEGAITVGTTKKTYEFITNDVTLTSAFYTLNIQYGNLNSGNQVWIEDVVLENITQGWEHNYITNGSFVDATAGWILPNSNTYTSFDNQVLINGNPTMKVSLPNRPNSSKWNTRRFYWQVYLYAGYKYVLSVDARSETGVELKPIVSATANSSLSFEATPQLVENGSYEFILPEITQAGNYDIAVCFGLAEQGSVAWLNNIKFKACVDGSCNETGFSSIQVDNSLVKLYPNPVTTNLFLSTLEKVQLVEIWTIDGVLCKKQHDLTNGYVDVSELPIGNYLVKVVAANVESQQMIIKR